jgi:acyl carrier protein
MEQLIAVLNEIRPGKDFARAENFFDQGMLDSLDLTALVAALESRYGIFVDVDEMVADRFCNVAAIKALLTSKGVNL